MLYGEIEALFSSGFGYDKPMNASQENLWPAPFASKSLDATVVVPGSKSLSNRYLILAALGHRPVRLVGLLRSRDTELMMDALRSLGVRCEIDEQVDTTVTVVPPSDGRFHGGTKVFCGLAGTVMRFVPGLAMFADGPVDFDGDEQAYARPMKPVLDGLEQLGACIEYHGEEGRLPFTIIPPQTVSQCAEPSVVSIDSSGSSQFISGLLLVGSRVPGGLELHHTGEKTPSLPHIRMTVADLQGSGVRATPTNTPVPTATPTNTPAPTGYKVGTTVKHPATNGYYKVTATDTVEYIKPIKKKVSTVTIPDSVNLKGANYKVTSIASKAFKSNKYLKKVIIGNNVIQIKSYAFYKCTKLSYVQIGGSVKAIGKESFYSCKKLNEMRIYTSRLKAKYVGSNAFKGTPSRMKVYVPRKKAKSYKTVFVKRGISKKIVIKKM